jgi:hypothetical protein
LPADGTFVGRRSEPPLLSSLTNGTGGTGSAAIASALPVSALIEPLRRTIRSIKSAIALQP